MSDDTPTTDPTQPEVAPATPAADTPAPAPAADTPAPAPAADTPAPAPAADTQPEIPAAAPAAPTPAPAPVAEPVAAAPSSSHVAVPKWVLATVAGVLGAAVMFGIGYAVGDDQAKVGTSSGSQGGGTQQVPNFPGNGNPGGNQQVPNFPGNGNQQVPNLPGNGNQGGTQAPNQSSGAFLGVATQQTSDGLEVVQVVSGSAADDAGLEVGDVIVEFDGNRVTTPAQLANAVSNLDVGDEVEVTYERDGDSRTVTVELGSRSTANSN